MNKTIWKTIPGHANYKMSDTGEVRNKNTGNILSRVKIKGGKRTYWGVNIYSNGKPSVLSLSRVYAQLFIKQNKNLDGTEFKGKINVAYRDDNPLNLSIENVYLEDMSHRMKRLHKNGATKYVKHESVHKRAVKLYKWTHNLGNIFIKEFESIAELIRWYPQFNKRNVLYHAKNKKPCKGYTFEFLKL